MNGDNPNSEIVVYVGDDGKPQVQARLQDENIWLTQVQLAQVFQTKRQNIGQHIKNIYEEKELDPSATIKKLFIVQTEGDREVSRNIEYYSLDMVIALGYRVKSNIATNFRIWATERLREYKLKAINHEPMRMADWVREADKFAATYGKGVLDNPGKISHKAMLTKVAKEYESYEERMRNQELSSIEQRYLEELKAVQKRVEGEEMSELVKSRAVIIHNE